LPYDLTPFSTDPITAQTATASGTVHRFATLSAWQELPPVQRWLVATALLLASQMLVFGLLYLVFGQLVVIGFLASILAGLATGLGRCRRCILRKFPPIFSIPC